MFPNNPSLQQKHTENGIPYTYTNYGWRLTSSIVPAKEKVEVEQIVVEGKDGKEGEDGLTPIPDPQTKTWIIGDTDTGVPTTGPQGNRGFGLQFNWDGTALGVKVENEPSYTYQDLQGPQGIQGEQGEPGDVTNAVSELERTNWNAAYTHSGLSNNPHSVTKSQVGLGNVVNESKETMFDNSAFTGTTTANKIKSNIITIPSAEPSSTVAGEWYFYIT